MMEDIIINERIKITNIRTLKHVEGIIYANLIYKKKKYNLKYDYIAKEMLGCSASGNIELPWNEGRGVWDLIKEALKNIKIT